MGDIGMHGIWSSHPVMSPEIYSHVTQNFIECINLKKSNILSIWKGIKSKNVASTVSSNLCKCEVK